MKAERFFRDVLLSASHPEVSALLVELADEEVGHQRMVRDQLAHLRAKGRVSQEDIADEPIAQD